jgi:hypothetical protein
MSKSRIAAVVVAMALVGVPAMLGPSAAFAANSTGTTDTSAAPTFTAADRDEDEDEGEESDHHEQHGVIPPVVIRPHQEGDEYGEGDGDDDDEDGAGGTLPPLPNATPSPGATVGPDGFGPAYNERGQFVVAPLGGPGSNGAPGAGPTVSRIDPQSAPAISMNGVKPATKSPSQIFAESATVGLTAMGVGAIALGGVAGVRAIRLRKNPTGDYFYESEK